MQDLRGIGQGGQDVLSSQLRILRHNLLNRQAIRQAPDDHPHRDAGARDAGLSVVNLGIGDDPLLPRMRFMATVYLRDQTRPYREMTL